MEKFCNDYGKEQEYEMDRNYAYCNCEKCIHNGVCKYRSTKENFEDLFTEIASKNSTVEMEDDLRKIFCFGPYCNLYVHYLQQ